MVFHGFWLVSMVFQGSFMVFRGFWLVSMVFKVVSWFFHGFWLVSMVLQGSFMVFSRIWLVSMIFHGSFMFFYGVQNQRDSSNFGPNGEGVRHCQVQPEVSIIDATQALRGRSLHFSQ